MHLALLLAFKVRVCSMFKFQVRQTWTHRFKLILNTWVKKCFQFLSQMIQQGRYSPHRPVWQCFLAGGYPKRKPELYGFFSFLSVLQSYYIHLRHQLGMCSDLCIQNQSKTEMTEQIWPLIQAMAHDTIIDPLSMLSFILDDQPKIHVLSWI